MIQIEKELCKKCNLWVELCPQKVFGRDEMGQPFVVDAKARAQCLTCVVVDVMRGGPGGASATEPVFTNPFDLREAIVSEL